jgi:Sulfatase-modifying factor enzyme 1
MKSAAPLTAPVSHEPAPARPDLSRSDRVLPYVVLGLVCLAIHGFLLTNDGVMWDGWYFRSWLTHRNWGAFSEYALAQGMPFSLLALAPLALFPDVVVAGMVAIVLCLWLQGVVVYRLALKLAPLTRGEALALAVLFQACPVVSAAQDFPILTLLFYHTLFFAGGLAAAVAMERKGWRHGLARLGAIVALVMSCWTNGSLLMVYGSLYVALFCFFLRREKMPWPRTIAPFLRRYPDLFVLPLVTLWARNTFSPQFGWFENYNKPSTDPATIWRTFWSFFENVLPYHAQKSLEWVVDHPFLAVGLVVFLVLWPRLAPAHWVAERSAFRSRHLLWFAGLAFVLGVLPLAIIGKTFLEPVYGENSRWSMHVPIPFALAALAVLRSMCFSPRRRSSRWFPAIAACAVTVLGSQIPPVYLAERADWIIGQAALHNAARNELVRGSSIITTPKTISWTRQNVYGIYAFGDAFGVQERVVFFLRPVNERFFTPFEVRVALLPTALVPNEFRRINPAGQQVFLESFPQRAGMSDGKLAWRYLWLRWFGAEDERSAFFSALCPVKAALLRSATPFPPGEALPPQALSRDARDLTNDAGVEMIYLPAGWWAGRFEITQQQYESLMNTNPSVFKDPYRPVECVSWNEAIEFCDRLTRVERAAGRLPEGFIYRLPDAAEFSYMEDAAAPVPAVLDSMEQTRWHTARVGSMPANRLRLHDVKGNVWEWNMDWWDRDERFKLSKGGSWTDAPPELSADLGDLRTIHPDLRTLKTRLVGPYRRDYPDQGFWDRGFRVVLAPPALAQRTFARDTEPWRQKR